MKTKTKHPPFCPWPTKLFWKVTVNALQHQYHICMPSTIPRCYWLMYISCCKWLIRRGPGWLKLILLTQDMTLHKLTAQEVRIQKSTSLKNSIYFMTKMKSNGTITNY